MAPRQPGDRSKPVIPGNERVLCLEAATGKAIWQQTYDCGYAIEYPSGPRATPVVSSGKVFSLGAMGDLRCHDATDGTLVWARNFIADFKTEAPLWGWSAHPLIEGNLLICTVGGEGSAVVAFERDTGKEVWRALTAKEICYAPPMIHEFAGLRQLVIWHADGLAGLNPQNGETYWTSPYPVGGRPQRPEVIIAAPRAIGDRLFLTSFYQGALMLEVRSDPWRAEVLWNRRSAKLGSFDVGLHTVLGTPVIKEGMIYGLCGMGELRCLDAVTGERKWETYAMVGGKQAFFGNAFIVEQAGRHFFFTDQGELVLGRLTPEQFVELGRARILEPLESTRGRTVVWCHPAFANRSMYAHNGRDMVCVSLAGAS
jgi:outer membrane protein assembly factor BamB